MAKLFAALTALLALALAYLLHDLDARVRAALIEQTHEVALKLGRPLSLGEVHVSLGRTSEIVLHALVVEGTPGATGELARPLLSVPEAHLAVALGPLLRSRGRVITIERFALIGPEITLVRTPTGLSIDDVRARLVGAPPPKPSDVRVSVASFSIADAKLHLLTQGGGAEGGFSIDPITLGATDLRLDAPSRLSLAAAALAPTANINAAVDLAPPAGAPPLTPTTLQRLEIHVAALPLPQVLAWLRAPPIRGLDLAEAELGVDAVIEPGAALGLRGSVVLAKARLVREIEGEGSPPERGEPTTLSFAADALLDLQAGTLAAKSFDLGLGEAKAHGSASVHGLGAAPEVDSLELQGSADAGALLALLPAGFRPRPVALAGPITLSIKGGGGRDRAHASFAVELAELRTLELDRAGKLTQGSAVAVGLAADLGFTREGGALQLSALKAHAGELTVEGDLSLDGLGAAPSIKALTLRAGGPSELLLGLGPPSRRPPGVALKGPFTASLSAHGDAVDLAGKATLDLGKVSLRAPGFAKPAGVPLSIEAEGHGSRAGGKLERALLRLASLSATAHGEIKGPEQLDLAFDARGGALGPLLALAPLAAERLGGTGSLDGEFAASGTLRRGQGQTRLDAKASLKKSRIRRGVLMLTGATEATLRVDASKGKLAVKADADLGAASLVIAGLFTKPVGKASRVAFTLGREGDHLRVQEARLLIPGLAVEGLDVSAEPDHLHVSAPITTLSMSALVEAMPLLEGRIPPALADATLRFALELDADPKKLDAARLHLRGVDLLSAVGHVNGSVDLDGLPFPTAVRFDVTGGELDLGAGNGKSEPFELPGDDLGKTPVSGHVHLDRLSLRGQTARALDLDVSVAEARITLDRLHAELLGGTLDADKSWLDTASVPELDLHARVTDLDLSKLPGAAAHQLQGQGSLRADLHGRGVSVDALMRALTGEVRVSGREIKGQGHMTHKVTVVNPLLGKLAERLRKKQGDRQVALHFREAAALFALGGGKLALKEPVLLRADAFTVRLDGTVGLDGTPALDGQIDIAPQAIAEATKGWLIPLRTIPLRLKLSGDAGELKVELIEIGASLTALAGARENAVESE
jgi:hypothetical protein